MNGYPWLSSNYLCRKLLENGGHELSTSLIRTDTLID